MKKDYYITIHGEKIPVSKEVYYAYWRPKWKEHKRSVVREDREWSLDSYVDAGGQIRSNDLLIEEIVEDKILLEMLLSALESLSEPERELIDALYFQGLSERAYAEKSATPRMTITYRRDRIIKKLKKIFGKL